MEFRFTDVNDAFLSLVRKIYNGELATRWESRQNTPVAQHIDEPLVISYTSPTRRVLFNAARNANPFFYLYNALWSLAGANDTASLAYYAPVRGRSDDGVTLKGAHGYRWRHAARNYSKEHDQEYDQLEIIIDHLRRIPDSNYGTLQMWNVEDDLARMEYGKDICRGLSAAFTVREHARLLDMTVFSRKSDIFEELLGEDYVQFSLLQEYVAARLGLGVGRYCQIANAAYVRMGSDWFVPEKWLAATMETTAYAGTIQRTVPLIQDPDRFDRELQALVAWHDGRHIRTLSDRQDWCEPFITQVAHPMLCAFQQSKEHSYSEAWPAYWCIQDDAWRVAATHWISRQQQLR